MDFRKENTSNFYYKKRAGGKRGQTSTKNPTDIDKDKGQKEYTSQDFGFDMNQMVEDAVNEFMMKKRKGKRNNHLMSSSQQHRYESTAYEHLSPILKPGGSDESNVCTISEKCASDADSITPRVDIHDPGLLQGIKHTFPFKLHAMLSDNKNENCITWSPDGKAWKVMNEDILEKVLPHYYGHANFRSFIRQAYLWKFRRLPNGKNAGHFYHELFMKDDPLKCKDMERDRKRRVPRANKSIDKGAVIAKDSNVAQGDVQSQQFALQSFGREAPYSDPIISTDLHLKQLNRPSAINYQQQLLLLQQRQQQQRQQLSLLTNLSALDKRIEALNSVNVSDIIGGNDGTQQVRHNIAFIRDKQFDYSMNSEDRDFHGLGTKDSV